MVDIVLTVRQIVTDLIAKNVRKTFICGKMAIVLIVIAIQSDRDRYSAIRRVNANAKKEWVEKSAIDVSKTISISVFMVASHAIVI